MNLADVMDAVAERLSVIDGLAGRVFAYPPAAVTPPAAVVSYPDEYTFDATYGRGMDRMTLPVALVVGRPTDRSTRDRLAGYCDGSGVSSVKAALESGAYSVMDTLRVVSVSIDAVSIGGVEYAAALFELDITGPGSK